MKQEIDYSEVEKFNLMVEWNKKEWITLDKFDQLAQYKEKAGIYRIMLLNQLKMPHHYIIGNNKLSGTLPPKTVLSIGKSSDLLKRLGIQHFGTSYEGNRLGRHLAVLFPEKALKGKYIPKRKNAVETEYFYINKDIAQELISQKQIFIQFFIEDLWWKRDLFETYGKALYKCLFDLGIEH